MPKEIDDKTARSFAESLVASFKRNPNDTKGGAEDLANAHNSDAILGYNEEDLLANQIIKNRLFEEYKKIKLHPEVYRENDRELNIVLKSELERVLRWSRNKSF